MSGTALGARLCGALAALASVASAWGFSVDDALISARVAAHLAHGHGYRFNAAGPSTDCVTPLGWAYLLAPFASGGPEAALAAAALLGAALWIGAAALLGQWGAALCTGARRWAFFACIASSLPLGAWACSGMETGLVLALGVGALAPGVPGALCAGLAAALRPELVPWAATLSFGQALAVRSPLRARVLALLLALLPALLVALVRWRAFGLPVPLAVYAKPSDFEHGLRYVFGAVALAGPALTLLGWGGWRTLPPRLWAVALSFAVHLLILLGVGGDWMPLWRLAVPTFPGVLLVGAALAERSSRAGNVLRALLLGAAAAQLHYFLGSDTRAVRARQSRIIADARPLLAGARRIGAVDVGWLGAATEQHLVDFAGVTEPAVAYLSGGHTSKRLPRDFLERQRIDTLVLRRSAGASAEPRWAYQVDARVLTLRGAERFRSAGTVPLAAGDEYVVLRDSAGAMP